MAIREITEKKYDDALSQLPPHVWLANRFLKGEASHHRMCKITKKLVPVFHAYFFAFGRYFESDPMSYEEFKAFKSTDLPLPK